ncbi:class I SAM-dependent methyltransferase [Rubellimicrobium roseum]|uniref:class I SAM-dependent methyltransferase n=1 Tax=Rubellimicrobium roseum TaxID=687525 RepID=UPI001C3F240A|nr:methyltransferase domain-containing protein [Rubellimicrobium roseum]
MTDPLPPAAFAKEDAGDDTLFYRPARLVTHIDEPAVAALSAHYARRLRPGDRVLDLMSSWVSHLPPDLPLSEVVGHGMNATELAANPRLTRWWVQDLNRDAALPLPDASLDAVLCCVGVQYLQRPFAVFAEVRRVLAPGGRVIVSFSNRCFPTKAVAAWRSLDMAGRAALVRLYLERAGFDAPEVRVLSDGRDGDPLVAVEARVPPGPGPDSAVGLPRRGADA